MKINKNHLITLTNGVVLSLQEFPPTVNSEGYIEINVWDNHNDVPDCCLGRISNYGITVLTNASPDLFLDELEQLHDLGDTNN